MILPVAVCVLIADSRRERMPLLAYQWAALRGLRSWRMDLATGDFCAAGLGRRTLLAMSYSTLASLGPNELIALKAAVCQGATLYVRGGFPAGQRCPLAPFVSGALTVGAEERCGGYRLTGHWLLPKVLRDETFSAELQLPSAHITDAPIESVAFRLGFGAGRGFICAMSCGGGVIIYDLMPDEMPSGVATPIANRLADSRLRCFDVGALAAVNHAAGRATAAVSAYNLVLDDRPRNFDYFNAARVAQWLSQVERICPGTHVDFAWTPRHSRPSARYIGALKRFNTGFVWHGLHRHVDHRLVRNFCADHRQGLRRMEKIARRYSVSLQPIMILPFQDVDEATLLYLRGAGFSAAVFHADPRPGILPSLPGFMHYSTVCHDTYIRFLPALRRYLAPELTRDKLLANAALDLPIIAAAHPFEVGLRRFTCIYRPWEAPSRHFDEVLSFAREKGLRPLSLQEIAQEMIAAPRPDWEVLDAPVTMEGIDIAI